MQLEIDFKDVKLGDYINITGEKNSFRVIIVDSHFFIAKKEVNFKRIKGSFVYVDRITLKCKKLHLFDIDNFSPKDIMMQVTTCETFEVKKCSRLVKSKVKYECKRGHLLSRHGSKSPTSDGRCLLCNKMRLERTLLMKQNGKHIDLEDFARIYFSNMGVSYRRPDDV